jgi:hypothetical protein
MTMSFLLQRRNIGSGRLNKSKKREADVAPRNSQMLRLFRNAV